MSVNGDGGDGGGVVVVGTGDRSSDPERQGQGAGEESGDEISWKELLQRWDVMRVGLVLALGLQATGINTIIYYAPDIFSEAGLGDDTLVITMSIGAWNLLTVIPAYMLVDRYGRKTLFQIGMCGVTMCCVILSFVFFVFEDDAGVITVIFLFLFIGFFELGPGAFFWGIVAEMYGARIRGKFGAYVNFLQWFFNLILSLAFPPLLSTNRGNGIAFLIFACMGVICTVALQRLLPSDAKKSVVQRIGHFGKD